MTRRLSITDDLAAALAEITPPGTGDWTDTATVFLRGSVADFWQSASQGSGLDLERYRERVRAFIREGDSLADACNKARD